VNASSSRKSLGLVAVAAGLAAIVFGAVTWAALESAEVVVLRTFDADGKAHESRVWIADDEEGRVWIEAAESQKPFYLRLIARPEVELLRAGETKVMRASAFPGEEGHRRIRDLLAAKYGWRDVWVGLLVDTSASVAVRLEPAPGTPDSLSPSGAGVR
jgi:hypothetical protein